MSKKGMKLTSILQNSNQDPQSDQKYQSLRKNIRNSKQKIIISQLPQVSHVSRRFQSLSPQQAELIKNIAYIPVNCGLRVTSNEEKYHQAIDRRYVAIDMHEKQGSKPISPNTFQQLPKNKKHQVVYEYHCPNGEGQDQQFDNTQHFSEGMIMMGDRRNNFVRNQQFTAQEKKQQKISTQESQAIKRNSAKISAQKLKTTYLQNINGPLSGHPINEKSVKNQHETIIQGSTIKDRSEIFRENDHIQDRKVEGSNFHEDYRVYRGTISVQPIKVMTQNKQVKFSQVIKDGSDANYSKELLKKHSIKNTNQKVESIQKSKSHNNISSQRIIYGPAQGQPINSHEDHSVVEGQDSTLISHPYQQYYPVNQTIRTQNISSSTKVIRQGISPNRVSYQNSQQGNIYSHHQEYNNRIGGRNSTHYWVANDDKADLNGPAFFEVQGRTRYNQIATRSYGQQYDNRSKGYDIGAKLQYSSNGNIEIGGTKTKANTKDTYQDFQANIGINSKHNNNKNITSTKEHSKRDHTKEDPLTSLETEVKGQYQISRVGNDQMESERQNRFVQKVESRIYIGGNPEAKGHQEINEKKDKRKIYQVSKQQVEVKPKKQSSQRIRSQQNQINQYADQSQPLYLNISTHPAVNPPISPSHELEQRKKKVSEYQQTGAKGYNFKKSQMQDSEIRRKKEEYKYNLYSVIDEQFNLKCATGLCVPNEICATSPKREGWK